MVVEPSGCGVKRRRRVEPSGGGAKWRRRVESDGDGVKWRRTEVVSAFNGGGGKWRQRQVVVEIDGDGGDATRLHTNVCVHVEVHVVFWGQNRRCERWCKSKYRRPN